MTAPRKVLVVDDEPQIRRLLKSALARAAYAVVEADTARAALAAVDIDHPDVILLDLGLPVAKEASMVKLEATEMSIRVTNQAMQLHGGNGYTTERQVERHWRDARLTTIFEGTSEIQKRIISDRMLPRSPLT